MTTTILTPVTSITCLVIFGFVLAIDFTGYDRIQTTFIECAFYSFGQCASDLRCVYKCGVTCDCEVAVFTQDNTTCEMFTDTTELKEIKDEPQIELPSNVRAYAKPSPTEERKTVFNPTIPASMDVGATRPRKTIIIKGTPTGPDIGSFAINILHDLYNVAFMFDIRFENYGSTRLIVLNTYTNEVWGQEIRPSYFPFEYGETFEIGVFCEPDRFRVEVFNRNATFIMERRPDHGQGDDNILYIYGDVIVDSVTWFTPCPSDPNL